MKEFKDNTKDSEQNCFCCDSLPRSIELADNENVYVLLFIIRLFSQLKMLSMKTFMNSQP